MLHGLYWLLNNLADDGPVALVRGRRALVRRRVDPLPQLPRAAARRGRRGGPCDHPQRRRDDAGSGAARRQLPRRAYCDRRRSARRRPATLCERRLGTAVADEFAAACHEATAGNPFLLEALLRDARDQGLATDARSAARVRRIGPAAVAQAVLLRLTGAPPAATAIVRALAILGDGASVAEAAGLAAIGEDEAARAVDLLVALAILAPARPARVRASDRPRVGLRGHRCARAGAGARRRGRVAHRRRRARGADRRPARRDRADRRSRARGAAAPRRRRRAAARRAERRRRLVDARARRAAGGAGAGRRAGRARLGRAADRRRRGRSIT